MKETSDLTCDDDMPKLAIGKTVLIMVGLCLAVFLMGMVSKICI